MSEIAVDFLLGPDWRSRLIAWYGDEDCSHCASVIRDMYKGAPRERYLDARSDVLDDIPAGVHIRDPVSERWIKKRRATLKVSLTEYQEWEANLRAKITTEYDKYAILGFLEGKSLHTAGRWICSALAINAVQHIRRVPYPLVKPAHQITPGEVLLILQAVGFTIGPILQPI